MATNPRERPAARRLRSTPKGLPDSDARRAKHGADDCREAPARKWEKPNELPYTSQCSLIPADTASKGMTSSLKERSSGTRSGMVLSNGDILESRATNSS